MLFNGCVLECETPTGESTQIQGAIKPHELRALNFLINEYLLQHNYKLTSITFADENENQVGLTVYINEVRVGPCRRTMYILHKVSMYHTHCSTHLQSI